MVLFLTCLIRTLFRNPGYFHKEYIEIYSITRYIKALYYFIINPEKFSLYLKNYSRSNEKYSLINEIKELYQFQVKLPEEILNSNSLTSSNDHKIDTIFNEIEQYNMEQNDKKEKTQLLNEELIFKFQTEYSNFLNSRKEFKNFNKLTFYSVNKENFRICGYCLVQKVNIHLLIYSQIEPDTVDIVEHA